MGRLGFPSLSSLLPGDDIFISYSRADGASYAAGLASELTAHNLSCRLDQWGSEPGREVPQSILRAVRRAGMLVVVATAAAGKSPAVREEIETFLPTRRLIVPVDLDGAIRQADWWPRLEGLAVSIEEPSAEGQRASRPRPAVLDRIENSINFTRRNERLRRTTIATSAVLLLLTAAAVVAARVAASAQDRSRELADLNGRANHQLAETKSNLTAQQDKLSRQLRLTNDAIAELGTAQHALNASKAQYATQKDLTAKATEERTVAETGLAEQKDLTVKATEERVAAEAQLAVSKADLERQSAIAESQELARLAPSAPTKRQRINEAVKAVKRSPTEAARLNLANILLNSLGGSFQTKVEIGPGGQQVAIVSGVGDAKYVDFSKQTEFPVCGYPEPIDTVAFSPDGKYLATAAPDGSKTHFVQIWDLGGGIQTGTAEINGGSGIFKFWMSPDSRRLALNWGDSLYMLDVPTARILTTIKLGTENLTNVTFDPHHRTLLAESNQGNRKLANIFDVDSGSKLWTHSGDLEVEWFGYTGDSKLVLYLEGGPAARDDRGFDVRPNRAFEILPLNSSGVPGPAQSFTIEQFDYADLKGGSIKYLQLGKSLGQALRKQYPAAMCGNYNQPANAGGEFFLCFDSGKSDAPVLFDLQSRRTLGPLAGWVFGDPEFAYFSPDSSLIEIESRVYTSSSLTRVMSLWDRSLRRFLWKREGFQDQAEFSADGNRLFLAYTHEVFDSRSGVSLGHVRNGDLRWIGKDGRRVLGQDDTIVFLWDVDAGKELRSIDITTPDHEASQQAFRLLKSGSYSVDDLLAIARRELHECSPKP